MIRSKGALFILAFFLFVLFLIDATGALMGKCLFINLSQSEALGIYYKAPLDSFKPGKKVLVTLPSDIWEKIGQRPWLHTQNLIKEVAAVSGDRVCEKGEGVFINGSLRAFLKEKDSYGAPLPRLVSCRTLFADEVFLLSTRHPNSFDSRYFGPVKKRDVLGEARLLFQF